MRISSKVALILGLFATIPACKSRHEAQSEVQNDTLADAAATTMAVTRLTDMFRRYYTPGASEADKQKIRAEAWAFLLELEGQGRLKPVFLALAKVAPQTRDLPPEQQAAAAEQVHGFVAVELENRERFRPWPAQDDLMRRRIDAATAKANGDLRATLADLGRTVFTAPRLKTPEDTMPLVNGPASWAVREPLIENARESIWVFCWAFYDDHTGREGAEALIRKRAQGIDVRVVVDGPVSMGPRHNPVIKRLIEGGVQVIRWNHASLKGFGMHRKLLIVDHSLESGAAVFGGMNYGDEYRHHPAMEKQDFWRDTDMVVRGAPVLQAAGLFAATWNRYLKAPGTLAGESSPGLSPVTPPAAVQPATGENLFAFVDVEPSQAVDGTDPEYLDPVYLVTLKMIQSAQRTIDISNAYFITSPPIEKALAAAMAKGRKVRVHSNSDASLCAEDKPLLVPIYHSFERLLRRPAPVPPEYVAPEARLQQKTTLHSKYMVVDGLYGWIGSYNIHPRSSLYEGETVGMFHGPALGRAVQAMFDADAAAAPAVTDPAKVAMPPSPTTAFFSVLETFFFNQL